MSHLAHPDVCPCCANLTATSALAGLNINPTLIHVGGSGQANIAVGYSVSPALISVQPAVDLRVQVKNNVGSPILTANVIPQPPKPLVTPKSPKELPSDPEIGKLDVNTSTTN